MCFLRLAFTLATVAGYSQALPEAAWQLERDVSYDGQSLPSVWGSLCRNTFPLCGLYALANNDFHLERDSK